MSEPLAISVRITVAVRIWASIPVYVARAGPRHATIRLVAGLIVAVAVTIKVGPLSCIFAEIISLPSAGDGGRSIVAIAVAVSIKPLSWIVGEEVSINTIGVIAVTIRIQVSPLGLLVREGVSAVGAVVFAGFWIVCPVSIRVGPKVTVSVCATKSVVS